MTGKKPLSRRFYWLGLLLLLGAGIRLLYLVFPYMDADQAINGLMARHVLLGEFPIFFYGQEYCGSIEAYLVSTIFLLIRYLPVYAGPDRRPPLPFPGFFYLSAHCPRVGPEDRPGGCAVDRHPFLLLCLPFGPGPISLYGISGPGDTALYLAVRILYVQDRHPAQYLWLGLLSGLGLWTHFLFVFYLTPVGLLLLLKEKVFWRDPKVLAYLSAGVVLGGLPLWVYNAIHPLATWVQLQHNPVHEPFADSLIAFFSVRLPELLGCAEQSHQLNT